MTISPKFEKFLDEEGLSWEIKAWTNSLYYSVRIPGKYLTYALLEDYRILKTESIPIHELVSLVYSKKPAIMGPDDVENLYRLWLLEHGV